MDDYLRARAMQKAVLKSVPKAAQYRGAHRRAVSPMYIQPLVETLREIKDEVEILRAIKDEVALLRKEVVYSLRVMTEPPTSFPPRHVGGSSS